MNTKATRREIALDEAIRDAEIILNLDNVSTRRKIAILKDCIWQITEAEGKYRLHFYSAGVKALIDPADSSDWDAWDAAIYPHKRHLRHEHVFPIKFLVGEMLNDPACVADVLTNKAVACLVTKDEHLLLKGSDGWARYERAGISVYQR